MPEYGHDLKNSVKAAVVESDHATCATSSFLTSSSDAEEDKKENVEVSLTSVPSFPVLPREDAHVGNDSMPSYLNIASASSFDVGKGISSSESQGLDAQGVRFKNWYSTNGYGKTKDGIDDGLGPLNKGFRRELEAKAKHCYAARGHGIMRNDMADVRGGSIDEIRDTSSSFYSRG